MLTIFLCTLRHILSKNYKNINYYSCDFYEILYDEQINKKVIDDLFQYFKNNNDMKPIDFLYTLMDNCEINLDLFNFIISNYSINIYDDLDRLCLLSCRFKMIDVTKCLLEKGANIELLKNNIVLDNCNYDMLLMLLQNGLIIDNDYMTKCINNYVLSSNGIFRKDVHKNMEVFFSILDHFIENGFDIYTFLHNMNINHIYNLYISLFLLNRYENLDNEIQEKLYYGYLYSAQWIDEKDINSEVLMLEKLLKKGINIEKNLTEISPTNILSIIINRNNDVSYLKCILDNTNIDRKILLDLSIYYRNITYVQYLFEYDISLTDENIEYCCKDLDLLKLIVNNNVDINRIIRIIRINKNLQPYFSYGKLKYLKSIGIDLNCLFD